MLSRLHILAFLLLAVSPISPATAQNSTAKVDYLSQIKPLLESKCYSCHGVLKQEGGLRLETKSLMLAGGDSGPAINQVEPNISLILERVTADEDSRMPPNGEGAALKPHEIKLIRQWIAQGASAPDEEAPESPTEHWAFQPVKRPSLPESTSSHNPIDVLLARKHQELGLSPRPSAERSILIRRLYLDLIGLPPSLEQLHDDRPFEQIIDELLASPHHGERWGRHWMDIWRYSDWYGLGAQLRYSQKHMWHWRDWIIESLNSDKGYDRMIQEMLAGDELAPNDPDVVAGTGFLARNYYLFNRTTWLDQTIEHTGKAFLGLTLNCTKCHDHKYDPFTQVDYYSMRAIFEPHQVRLDPVPGETDLEKNGLPRVFDDQPDAETYLHIRGNPKDLDRETQITPGVPALFASFQPNIKSVELPPEAWAPGTRDYVQQDYLKADEQKIEVAMKELEVAQQKLEAARKMKPQEESSDADFRFTDNFDTPNPEAWEIVGSDWKYENGTVLRTTSTRNPEFLRFRQPLPKDFEVTCRYTTTGGATYKSVTFRFDESEDQSYGNFVYSSAHAPGPKVHVAFTRNGNSTYPPEGRSPQPITIGTEYVLRFAVRDRLVNVWLDDKFIIAYTLPDRQPKGRFTLSGFDATVAFDHITIRSLPTEVQLTKSTNEPVLSPQDAEAAVSIAEAKLRAAQARHQATSAIIEADKARYFRADETKLDELITTAAIAEAKALLAEAEQESLAAGGDSKKVNAANNKRKRAEDQLEAAKNGEARYSAFRASRKALEGPDHKEADYAPTYSQISTGRRLALAGWITSQKNPLTARVAVNHVWMRHFGTPLVESVFDFGLRAKKPVHSELLDLLASEFVDSGWSFKHLHRLITTSQTYQRSSSTAGTDAATLENDADNTYYWRMNTRRMESQLVRDSILQLAGALDPTLGGPSLDVGNSSRRRSIYFKHSRDQQDKFLTMFDDADLLQCYRRSESIVPQQALALANSSLSMSNAEAIAQRIVSSTSDNSDESFSRTAIELLLGRVATEDELQTCVKFCIELRKLLTQESDSTAEDPDSRVRTRLIHSLLNHNDFVSIR